METLHYCVWRSLIGPLTLVASERGLLALEFGGARAKVRRDAVMAESAEPLAACRSELERYFAGALRQFTIPLDLCGTEFQTRCWQALLNIPYGETRTYAQQARAIGHPRAFRAVGMANHDNPIAIIVPCHRVIASDGTLGGYGGGLALKRKLLDLERGQLVLAQPEPAPRPAPPHRHATATYST